MFKVLGDVNIDLLTSNTLTEINSFTIFFRQISFLLTYINQQDLLRKPIEYNSHSGNITIQLSDLQFVIFEGYFRDIMHQKINIFERNFNQFNERELENTLL